MNIQFKVCKVVDVDYLEDTTAGERSMKELYKLWQTERDNRGRLVCLTESLEHFVNRKLAIH